MTKKLKGYLETLSEKDAIALGKEAHEEALKCIATAIKIMNLLKESFGDNGQWDLAYLTVEKVIMELEEFPGIKEMKQLLEVIDDHEKIH